MICLQRHGLMIALIVEFWISGLFVLSVIFTQKDQIQELTLATFVVYAIGSFFAGVLSDGYGRKPIFLISTALLAIAACTLLFYPFCGYVIANLAIGPLNNLTFVMINQVYPNKNQTYTIMVLIGWAFSEITLGGFFLLSNTQVFYYGLLSVTALFLILAFMFVKETQQFLKIQLTAQVNATAQSEISNAQKPQQIFRIHKIMTFLSQKLFPSSLKPLIGGSILMFMMQMFYYRTQFTLDNFGVSLEINTIVVGCTQIFANLLLTKILQSMKRRLVLQVLVLSLMGLLVFLIVLSQSWVQTVVQGLMRLVDTAIMIVLGVYIPELFPSNQKGRGTNLIMSFGVIGSALNGKIFSHLPFWCLELFLLAALATTLLLKQTNLRKSVYKISTSNINSFNQYLTDKLIGAYDVIGILDQQKG